MTTTAPLTPKVCYTAAGILVHDNKVLLVKHKKLGIWLNPGGHVEGDELPHQTAEREFFEETGVQVRARDLAGLAEKLGSSEYQPNPILTNVHWVCRENFEKRSADPENFTPQAPWQRGCEQHLGFMYLVEPTGSTEFVLDDTETDGIAWFSPEEVPGLETYDTIKAELAYAFELIAHL